MSYHGVSDYANIAVFAPISNTERNYPLYVSLKSTKSSGKILLDQLVTIDYSARKYHYVETVPEKLIDELLMKVIFQKNEIIGY